MSATGDVRAGAGKSRLFGDIAFGVRLAVGTGSTLKNSLLRLGLIAIGIGLSTAVLLLLATAATALSHWNDRADAREPYSDPIAAAPLFLDEELMVYEGARIRVVYLEPLASNAPVPPGVQAIPAPGEMIASPELAERLNTDARLRARFTQHVVDTIGRDGLAGPGEMRAYVGTTGLRASGYGTPVSGFGGAASSGQDVPDQVVFLGVLGVLVVLIPLLVFVAGSSRIAGAERERRLSALRLAGATARQVRRIAAAEALVGAVAGELLGLVAFLVLRPLCADGEIAGITVFPEDFVPTAPLVALVLVLVPLIAVGSAWLGLRRLVVEPLGVVRMGTPTRRRLWWRLLLVALGVLALLADKVFGVSGGPGTMLPFMIVGTVLLLIGVPALTPWLTERAISRLRGGFPAWQLAVRRLQMDSGTPSRVVSGVVVVLAGVIALQLMLDTVKAASEVRSAQDRQGHVMVTFATGGREMAVLERVRAQPGVQEAYLEHRVYLGGGANGLLVAPCAALEMSFRLPGCADGDSFVSDRVRPGETYSLRSTTNYVVTRAQFTVPANAKAATPIWNTAWDVLLTPGAAASLDQSMLQSVLEIQLAPDVSDALQGIYAAVAPLEWRAAVFDGERITEGDGSFEAALEALLTVGAVLTLTLGGVSLLVMAVGQISERRRPLAALSAGGVPRGVLGRSLLWQNAVPMILGVALAVGGGIGIGALMLRLMRAPGVVVDWSFVVTLALTAIVLVLAVTAATLPSLRAVTRLEALRAE